MPWYVYILRCRDGVFYTGITKDLKRRLRQHNSGNGCKFTRYRAPVELQYSEKTGDRSRALIREAGIKRMSRAKKMELFI
jgi:putative endonuclease